MSCVSYWRNFENQKKIEQKETKAAKIKTERLKLGTPFKFLNLAENHCRPLRLLRYLLSNF